MTNHRKLPMARVTDCPACLGFKTREIPIDCPVITNDQLFCDEHLTHYTYKTCVWCFGTGKADIFTKMWRKLRES